MNELVYLKNDEAVCDSLQVAEKFEMRHDNVLRAIDNLQKSLLNFEEPSKMFIASKRKADDGQYHRMYLMNRDGFSLLVMGFTGKDALAWKLQYIKAFNQIDFAGTSLGINVICNLPIQCANDILVFSGRWCHVVDLTVNQFCPGSFW